MNKYMFSFLLTMTTTVFSAEDRALTVQALQGVIAAARQVSVAGDAPQGAAAVAASVSDALMGRPVAELADDDLKKSTVTAAADPAWVELFNKFRSVRYSEEEDQAEEAAAVAAMSRTAMRTVVAPLQARGALSEDARARHIAQIDGFLGAVEEMDKKSDLFAQLNFKVLRCLDALSYCPSALSASSSVLADKVKEMENDIKKRTPEELRKVADELEALEFISRIEENKKRMQQQQNLKELVWAAKSCLILRAELKHFLEKSHEEECKLKKETEQDADGAAAPAKS
jgi:hypothetical protein